MNTRNRHLPHPHADWSFSAQRAKGAMRRVERSMRSAPRRAWRFLCELSATDLIALGFFCAYLLASLLGG